MPGPVRVFVSYAHDDRRKAARIAAALRGLAAGRCEAGAEVWHDQNIGVGEGWVSAIESRIRQADVFVILISSAYLASRFIAEVELAFILGEQRDRGGQIVSVALDDVQLGMLSRFRVIDGQDRTPERIARELADAVDWQGAAATSGLVAQA